MATNISISLGTGISSFTYAYRLNNTRYPATGTYSGTSFSRNCDYVWVESVTFSSGYTGWVDSFGDSGSSTSVNNTYYESVTISGTQPAPVYYQWSITFNRNFTTSDTTSYSELTTTGRTASQSLIIPGSQWTRSGYTFSGWNTNRSGTGTWYYAENTAYFSANTTLYAIWTELPTAGYARVQLGAGIASVQYAYRDSNDVRQPSSGYYTATSTTTIYCHYLYIETCNFTSTYEAPWNASYSGIYLSSSTTPRSGTGTVNATLYPSTSATSASPATITLTGTAKTLNQYSITFNRNFTSTDATSFSELTTIGTAISQSLTIPNNQWTRSGYNFSGWNTNRSGTGTWYYAGNTYNFSGNTTLYAIWTATQYWVDAGIASGSSNGISAVYVNNVENGAYINYGSSATFTCDLNTGYEFVGWYSDLAGTNLVSGNQTYTISSVTSNRTLYAAARLITYSVFASSAGFGVCFSSVSVSASTVVSGGSVTFTANLNSGYNFRGWYNSNGTLVSTNRVYTTTITGNLTLYARANVQWTYEKSSGSSLISAEEWTRLQAFVTQRNGAVFTYSAIAGEVLRARLYNDTAAMIGLSAVFNRGQAIYASDLNRLITAANNI